MNASFDVTYRVDAENCLIAVNDDWAAFARENDAPELVPLAVLGRTLWDLIGDATTCELYKNMLERVREGLGPIRFGFRCDSPEMRRLLQMQITLCGEDEVLFEVYPLALESRPAVSLLQRAIGRTDSVIIICGWCKRVPVSENRWLEIEDAIPVLKLFDASALPILSHGMCPMCSEKMMKLADEHFQSRSKPTRFGDFREDTPPGRN